LAFGLDGLKSALDCGVMPLTTQRTDSWIMRHPLLAYLLLAFLITWLFWVPLAVLYHGRSDAQTLSRSPLVIVLQTLGVTGSLISAIVVIGLTRGKTGVRRLLNGLKRWRVGLWWYAAACLLVPALTVLGVAVRAVVGIDPAIPEGSPFAGTFADVGWLGIALTFPLRLFVACFGSPLLEEPGWRGFALPQMHKRMPAAWAALLVAAIWGFWHLPLYLAFDENLALSLSLITMHGFFLGWLYINTRSLLIAVLGHASLSVANNSLSLPDQGVVQIVLTLLLCVVILAFFRVNDLRPRLHFTRRTEDRRTQGSAP
jgi:membrane protease YdiL (CAAX protease family)